MGEWIVGALINIFGSIAINFGTNLLKLGHNEREKHTTLNSEGKASFKPIIYFQTWRIGLLIFFLGNCLNFMSFGYAAQSLLAALGSIQFVSNVAFAYVVFNRTVSVKVLVATAFIVLGNVFLVAFGNHQSPVYTPEQLAEKYSNNTFVVYCTVLALAVVVYHYIYRRGVIIVSYAGQEVRSYWKMLLPFSYAVVSGAVGSFSVLFAKSLSNLLRLAMGSGYSFHSLFTYSIVFLFVCTAGFWMTRLNEGLSLFDAMVIVPMFQIVWTFFSICTGFVYFQEYEVLDTVRSTMFVVGMVSVFIGISLLAPDEGRGGCATGGGEEAEAAADTKWFGTEIVEKAKSALGLGEDSINASAVLVMPMVSSRMTGFRGNAFERGKLFAIRNNGWTKIAMHHDDSPL